MSGRSWFASPDHRLWYYHTPRTSASPPDPAHVEETLDPQLRDLYDVLTSRGCVTKPSCAGHHRSRRDADRIFFHLVRDAEKIRGKGLPLTDLETGEDFLHRDAGWRLPWGTGEELGESLGSAGTGYIGATAPEELVDVLVSSLAAISSLLPALSYEHDGDTGFDIRVRGRDQRENDATWAALAEELDSLLP